VFGKGQKKKKGTMSQFSRKGKRPKDGRLGDSKGHVKGKRLVKAEEEMWRFQPKGE